MRKNMKNLESKYFKASILKITFLTENILRSQYFNLKYIQIDSQKVLFSENI